MLSLHAIHRRERRGDYRIGGRGDRFMNQHPMRVPLLVGNKKRCKYVFSSHFKNRCTTREDNFQWITLWVHGNVTFCEFSVFPEYNTED